MSIVAMDYEESLNYMSGLLRFGWKLGNERFEALCERMGNPQDQFSVVHIAGTKGKGSTTALTAAILQAAGFRVGAYFSPYVYDVRERVQVNGVMIPKEDFARLISLARPDMEALAETELGQTTEFELKTLIGFLYLAEQKVDFGCIEVGLGGRLDATNVVNPTVTVITNIGLDHMEQLGDTHALIAGEKAGIIKPGIPCFTAAENAEALEVIVRIASERGAPLTQVLPENSAMEVTAPAVRWHSKGHTEPVTIQTTRRTYTDLPMRMGGLYQRANAACAVAAAEEALAARGFSLSEEAVRFALANTSLPGRLAIVEIPGGPLIALDGAHNAMAAEALAGPVEEMMRQRERSGLRVVMGMLTGHEPAPVLAPFAARAAHLYLSQPDWRRALPVEELVTAARQFTNRISAFSTVEEAMRAALRDARRDEMILVTGSFYTVGEISPEQIAMWHQQREEGL